MKTYRTRTLVLSAIAAASLALSACAGGGSQTGSTEGGPVELRVTWWGNESRHAMTDEAIKAFEAKNPDISVQQEPGEWTAYWDKLATQTAAGDAPDVIQQDESQIATYGSGSLLDLSTQSDVLDLSGMDANVLDTGKVEGTQVGAPIGIGIYSVAVNPTILEQAGVPMPDDSTWTWDDFAATAAQVSEKLSGEDVYGISMWGNNNAELAAWTRQNGQELFPTEGQEAVTEDTVTSFYEFSRKLIEMKATPPASAQAEDIGAALDQTRFATRRAAFHLLFHTQIQAFATSTGDELKLLRLPAQASGESPRMVNKASMYWSVSARTEHPREAAMLVNFLLTDPEAAKILKVERGTTAIPEVAEIIEPELDTMGKLALDWTRTMQAEVVPPPQVSPPDAAQFVSEMRVVAADVQFDRVAPADAAKQTLQSLTVVE